jgi:SAM-dependent methyltransferase
MVGAHKRVLDIGAGPGSIARVLKEHGSCQVSAVEIDPDAIAKLAPHCEHVFECDLNDTGWVSALAGARFQVVVAADVLEHLYDPWTALRSMKEVLDEDGYVVVSLPHAGHSAVIACLLEEDFEYRDVGLLDRTHIRFFGIKNIQNLFNDSGLRILEGQFVVRSPEDTEFAARWRRVAPGLRQQLQASRFGRVYQVVVKARPDPRPADGIDLSSMSDRRLGRPRFGAGRRRRSERAQIAPGL